MVPTRKTVGVSEFKAKCLGLMDEVSKGAEIIVSKRGRPFAKVVRLEPKVKKRTRGMLKGEIAFVEDVIAPDWSEVFDFSFAR